MNLLKSLLILGGALVCSFVSPALSYAGGCGCRTYYTPPTVVKEYVTVPVLQPVPFLVPAFQFQYAPPTIGIPACPAATVQPAAVYPGVAPAITPGVAPAITPGVAPGYAQPVAPPPPQQVAIGAAASKDKIRELARALLEEMQRQSGEGGQEDNGPPEVPGLPPSQPQQQPQQVTPVTPPAPPTPLGNSAGGPNPRSPFASRAMAALSRNCAACHTGPASEGDAILFLQPGVINPNAPWKSMDNQIAKGLMPKKKTAATMPTADELAVMRAWLQGQ